MVNDSGDKLLSVDFTQPALKRVLHQTSQPMKREASRRATTRRERNIPFVSEQWEESFGGHII